MWTAHIVYLGIGIMTTLVSHQGHALFMEGRPAARQFLRPGMTGQAVIVLYPVYLAVSDGILAGLGIFLGAGAIGLPISTVIRGFTPVWRYICLLMVFRYAIPILSIALMAYLAWPFLRLIK